MSDYAEINPRFKNRIDSEANMPKAHVLSLHTRPMQLLAVADAEGVLAQVVDAIAILQVSDKLFSGSNPAWRKHHRNDLHSDLAAYVEVLRSARAGWKSDWIKNNGLDPTLYREAGEIAERIRKAYNLSSSCESTDQDKLGQLYALPFAEYHFKLSTLEPTNSGNSRAVYQSTRADHDGRDVRFVPSTRSIFAGSVNAENPPKFLCAVPRPMRHPPSNGAEYFELHFCSAVDEHGLVRPKPQSRRGLDALADLRLPE